VLGRKEPAPHTHSLPELGEGVGVPAELRRHLAGLRTGDRVGPGQDPKVTAFVRDSLPVLRQRFGPLPVVIFGSRARGDALSTSDPEAGVGCSAEGRPAR
jgi:hypothetical protein